MDTITVKFWDKKSITIDDIDLYTLTPLQLIKRMIIDKHLPDSEQAECYTVLDKENKVITDQNCKKTLEQLGFRNGDTVTIVKKHTNVQAITYIPVPTSPAIEQLESLKIELGHKTEEEDRINYQLSRYKQNLYHSIEEIKIQIAKATDEICRLKALSNQKTVDWNHIAKSIDNISCSMRSIDSDGNSFYDSLPMMSIDSNHSFTDTGFSVSSKLKELILSKILYPSLIPYVEGIIEAVTSSSDKAIISNLLDKSIEEINEYGNASIQNIIKTASFKIEESSRIKQKLFEYIIYLQGTLQQLLQSQEAYASIFCPAEIQKKSYLLVQVYVHSLSKIEKVIELSKESQKTAERRVYTPLAHNLRKGDKVDILLNIKGETLLKTEKKSLVWDGDVSKCSFDFFIPADIDIKELCCQVFFCVNELPIGDQTFITTITDIPSNMMAEVKSHKYKKIFISYSHKDEDKVRFLSEGFNMLDIPHFFDRKSLKAGDIFPEEIQKYIETADLFVLCWSENAAKSDYVALERRCALQRAYPQIKPQHEAKLSIYPLNIKPKAELPNDMKGKYHFGEFN